MGHFLEPETRCDFSVSEKRKKIWAVQIDLIQQLDIICKKYNLSYYASNGTLLGVIRHGGFIPWDDDVDIIMPRPDYDKLMSVWEEFDKPYFLQTAYNEKKYYRNYARLRNIDTTAIPIKDWNRDCHSGIFIDIFPMDGCASNKFIQGIRECRVKLLSALANTYMYYPDFESHKAIRFCINLIAKFCCGIFGYDRLLKKIDRIRSKTKYDSAKSVYTITHGSKGIGFPKEYYSEIEWRDFEYIKLPVPKNYDKILKRHYGNYMEFPEESQRGVHHQIFFDPDKAYTEYLNVFDRNEAKNYFNNY